MATEHKITDRELREKTGNPFLFGEPFYHQPEQTMENTEQPKTAPADIVKRLLDYRDEDGVASSAAWDGAQEIERLRDLCGIAAFAIKNRQQADAMMSVEGLIASLEEAGRGEPPFATNGYPRLDEIIKSDTTGTPYDDQVRRFTAISALATSEKVHPGYGGKPTPVICTDCVHFRVTYREQAGCAHPSVGVTVNPVDGHKTPNALCTKMRADGSSCGPDGLLYAPTDEAIRRPVCKNLIRKPFQLRISTPACTVDSSLWPSESANPSKEIACSGCAFSPNSH